MMGKFYEKKHLILEALIWKCVWLEDAVKSDVLIPVWCYRLWDVWLKYANECIDFSRDPSCFLLYSLTPWCDVIYDSSAWDLARMFTQSQCTVLYTHASLKPRIWDLTLRDCSPDAPSELLSSQMWAEQWCSSLLVCTFFCHTAVHQMADAAISLFTGQVILHLLPCSSLCCAQNDWGSEFCLHHGIPLHLLLRNVLFKMLCVIPFMINEQLIGKEYKEEVYVLTGESMKA